MLSQKLVEIGEARLEVFVGGADSPLVCSTHQYLAHQDLAHQDLAHQDLAHSARTAPFLDALAGAGRLVSVNPRGVGASSPASDPEDLGMSRLVDDLEAVRRQFGGEPWIFAGATIGGMIGLQYAVRYPHALRGLIVSGAAPSWRFAAAEGSIYHPSHPHRAPLTRPRRCCTTRPPPRQTGVAGPISSSP